METHKLRIAQVAPLWLRVPPEQYGGAELIVSWLTEELVRQGHLVTLFAAGGSQTTAVFRPTHKSNLVDAMGAGEAYEYGYYAVSAMAEVLSEAKSFDLIHSHLGIAGIPFSRLSPVPVIHTIHADLEGADEQWILNRYPEAHIASISDSQVATTPVCRKTNITTVYHGCDFEDYEFSDRSGSYLGFIGRMGPHKNPAGAIRIAREVGMPIILAGGPMDQSEREYFEAEVEPLIKGDSVKYLGLISQAAKVKLLRDAAALLFPIRWEEHFGVAMIEAMACGTPVVANRRGSVPEVIDPGVTGYCCDDESALAGLVSKALALDRARVRAHARKRFSHLKMVANYLKLYHSLLGCSQNSSYRHRQAV